MSDMIAEGIEHLADTLLAYASQSITYQRGASTISLTAVVGPMDISQANEGSLAMISHTRDFIVKTADLSIDDSPLTPRVGDRILHTANGITARYEVLEMLADGCWRWTDGTYLMRRIHAKQVG